MKRKKRRLFPHAVDNTNPGRKGRKRRSRVVSVLCEFCNIVPQGTPHGCYEIEEKKLAAYESNDAGESR